MEEFLNALADAGLDTLKILPFLLAVHILIEFIEQSAIGKIRIGKLLNGRYAPAAATALGLIPQCGFSVVATKLYAKKNIRLGTLLAVYIATSDEALPILISTPDAWGKIWPLLLIKLVYAVIAGYVLNLILHKQHTAMPEAAIAAVGCCGHKIEGHEDPGAPRETGHEDPVALKQSAHGVKAYAVLKEAGILHQDTGHGHEDSEKRKESGCKNTSPNQEPDGNSGALQNKKPNFFARYLKHPLIHTLVIAAFIFGVNFAFSLLFEFLGEETIFNFLSGAKYAQPFIAGLIGLIPNCGASVAVTQAYAIGGLSLGAAVSGLSVGAGVAYAVLFKENKSLKQNLFIVGGLYAASCLLGLGISLAGL